MGRAIVLFSMLAVVFAATLTTTQAARAAPMRWGGSAAGNAALNWAEANADGCWYRYGGAGPCGAGYDCSGLVMAAFAHAGIALPHSTYAMLASPRLHRVPPGQEKRGDLAFYGSGHVEITTAWESMTFGAHDSGSRVGWITEWMQPTFYRVY